MHIQYYRKLISTRAAEEKFFYRKFRVLRHCNPMCFVLFFYFKLLRNIVLDNLIFLKMPDRIFSGLYYF